MMTLAILTRLYTWFYLVKFNIISSLAILSHMLNDGDTVSGLENVRSYFVPY